MADKENPEDRRADPEQIETNDYEGPDRRKRAPGSVGRRHSDRKGPRHARDFWLFLVTLLVFFALHNSNNTANNAKKLSQSNRDVIHNVQEGRTTGSAISCAVISAFGQAGKEVISGSANAPENALTIFLEQHGYPPQKARRQQAVAAGDAYIKSISDAIENKVGHKGDNLVKPDGTINCKKLAALSNLKVK